MNNIERFLAVVRFQKPDYVPIFGFRGAPGMSGGCMKHTHDRLVATGMPASVGGCYENGVCRDLEGWFRYWGTIGHEHITPDFYVTKPAQGFRTTTRREGGFDII